MGIQYRSDIDGLRAVAILSVIGYHLFPSVIPGGFVGVDIFFVISGYLISSIIFQKMHDSSFNIFDFYKRRILRIFPALIIVISVSLIFGWLVLLPSEFQQLGKHIAGGAAYVSNFILLNETGYFDAAAETKPLLHLWSLGIEEQFYILWPIIVILLFRAPVLFALALIALMVFSFWLNISTIHQQPEAAFYAPWNRAWELILGAILAYIQYRNPRWKMFYSQVGALAGLGIIVFCIFWFSPSDLFPGWRATAPTVAAILIIASGPDNSINRIILSHPLMVGIGLISYPLYLWHWPLNSYTDIIGLNGPKASFAILVFSFLLAFVTYRWIERGVRRRRSNKTTLSLFTTSIAFIAAGIMVYWQEVPSRIEGKDIHLIQEAIGDWSYPTGMETIDIDGIKAFRAEGSRNQVTLFIGDSHIEQYSPRILDLIEKGRTNTAVFATEGGCPPIPGVYEDKHTSCTQHLREVVLHYAMSDEVQNIVIGAAWGIYLVPPKPNESPSIYHYYFSDEKQKLTLEQEGKNPALLALKAMIETLSATKNVFFVLDNAIDSSFDPHNITRETRISLFNSQDRSSLHYDDPQNDVRNQLAELGRSAHATIIDPVSFMCPNGICQTRMKDGRPIYKDSGHMRPFYVRGYASFIDQTIIRND